MLIQICMCLLNATNITCLVHIVYTLRTHPDYSETVRLLQVAGYYNTLVHGCVDNTNVVYNINSIL